jgi:methanogenic corrinoid protein MtbC1
MGTWSTVNCELAQERLALLTQAIEAEIIPRLAQAHRPAGAARPRRSASVAGPSDAEVVELTQLVITQDASTVFAYVEMIRSRGVLLESIYLELLAPAARRLGQLWTEDQCDFTAVTIGTGRLHQVIRELGGIGPTAIQCTCQGNKAVFAPTSGEQHTLGLVMVAEFFVRGGWDVCASYPVSRSALNTLVRNEWFDLIGLSAGSEGRLDTLAEDVRSSRRASCNRAVIVLVGGPVFIAHPEWAARVGADATAADGCQALAKAERLVKARAARLDSKGASRSSGS